MVTGFVLDEQYLWHDTGSAASHMPAGVFIQPKPLVESSESKGRFRNFLEVNGLLKILVVNSDCRHQPDFPNNCRIYLHDNAQRGTQEFLIQLWYVTAQRLYP